MDTNVFKNNLYRRPKEKEQEEEEQKRREKGLKLLLFFGLTSRAAWAGPRHGAAPW